MIRFATENDLNEIRNIEIACFIKEDQITKAGLRLLIKRGKGCFLVCDVNEINGYIYITKHGRIYSIASIVPGTGTKLLSATENIITLNRLYLEVRQTNLKAIALYTKHSYIAYGIKKHFYSNGEDAVLMEKELRNG